MSEKVKKVTKMLTSTMLISIKKYASEKRTLKNKEYLIPSILCEQDNFNKTPGDMRYYISLIPLTIEETEKMPDSLMPQGKVN
ncbi:hypothetical protein [Desulfotomaculum nigrificans]|uniref:hypothetical protein n=1 Tax=Desulfotomaculum nigrificans TaxID=1565 RepID=UPI0001FAEADE|nr:hypothetical protein [Desulfotomaculum nigrificans]